MASIQDFFSDNDKKEIKKAILNAEMDTSGEIRVHLETTCKGEVLDRASYLFKKLGMENTQLSNGVLFYIAVKSQKFAIIGDKAINATVPENFWVDIKENMRVKFKKGDFVPALVEGIETTGKQLKRHFPHHLDDINELTDEISFGD
ncbi:MAG: TPM domain-containing protein [Chlorobi bacterium]|nr:TPM domain-containing protein [Chlorobiota bacterium]